MNKSNRGNDVITIPLILVFCIFMILIIFLFVSSIISSYIWYEKMQTITLKYMYILEQYGYLTENEKQKFIDDLITSGFDRDNIELKYTNTPKEYGTEVFIDLKYNYKYNVLNVGIGWNKSYTKYIPMRVYKVTYSKK